MSYAYCFEDYCEGRRSSMSAKEYQRWLKEDAKDEYEQYLMECGLMGG